MRHHPPTGNQLISMLKTTSLVASSPCRTCSMRPSSSTPRISRPFAADRHLLRQMTLTILTIRQHYSRRISAGATGVRYTATASTGAVATRHRRDLTCPDHKVARPRPLAVLARGVEKSFGPLVLCATSTSASNTARWSASSAPPVGKSTPLRCMNHLSVSTGACCGRRRVVDYRDGRLRDDPGEVARQRAEVGMVFQSSICSRT